MMSEINWPSDSGMHFIVACILLTFGYISYWFLSHSERFIDFLTRSNRRSSMRVAMKGITGFVLMGFIPLIVLLLLKESPANWGLNFRSALFAVKWIAITLPIMLFSAYFASNNKSNLELYPQIRETVWTTKTFVIDYSTWAVYLLGYEFLFRGIFLFGAVGVLGNVEAIFLTSTVYSLAHLPKGPRETIGSFVVGLVMAYVTLYTGSILFSWLFHLIMACSNSFFSFRRNPEMNFHGNE